MKKIASIILIAFMPILSSCGTLPDMSTPVLQPGYTYEVIQNISISNVRGGKENVNKRLKIAVVACDARSSSYLYELSADYYLSPMVGGFHEVSSSSMGCASILPSLDFKSDVYSSHLATGVYTVRINSIEAGNTLLHVRAMKEAEAKRAKQVLEQGKLAAAKTRSEKMSAASAKGCDELYVGKSMRLHAGVGDDVRTFIITGLDVKSEKVSLKSDSGYLQETSCYAVQKNVAD